MPRPVTRLWIPKADFAIVLAGKIPEGVAKFSGGFTLRESFRPEAREPSVQSNALALGGAALGMSAPSWAAPRRVQYQTA